LLCGYKRGGKISFHRKAKKTQERPEDRRVIANALIVTVATLLALAFYLMSELRFLIPYRRILIHQYGVALLCWLGVLFVNVFAAVYALERKFFLKDTGRKLSHIDKQTLAGDSSVPYQENPVEVR
jgi:hypothetical protein